MTQPPPMSPAPGGPPPGSGPFPPQPGFNAFAGQPQPGQPYPGQPYPGQPRQDQPQGQPQQGQPQQGQPQQGQFYPGQVQAPPGPGGFGPPNDWTPSAPPRETTPATTFAAFFQVAALILVPLGAALPFGENFSSSAMWSTTTTWASFATLAAIIALAPLIGRLTGRPAAASWRVGAVAVGALVGFWVLIVLPGISAGQNFVVTLGVFAAAIGLWLSPGRQL